MKPKFRIIKKPNNFYYPQYRFFGLWFTYRINTTGFTSAKEAAKKLYDENPFPKPKRKTIVTFTSAKEIHNFLLVVND